MEDLAGVLSAQERLTLQPDAGSPGYPFGTSQSVISVPCEPAPRCSCDCFIVADDSWSGVTFRLLGRINEAVAELDVVTLGDDIDFRDAHKKGFSGALFAYDGAPCDEFKVEAFRDSTRRTNALLTLRAWGHHGAQRVLQPYAPLHEEVDNTVTRTNNVPEEVFAAREDRRRWFVSGIDITHDVAASVLCSLIEVPASGPPITRRQWYVGTGGVQRSYTKPLKFGPGSAVQFQADGLGGGGVGTAICNLDGFTQ